MTTSEFLYSIGGAALIAMAHYISTGKPPLFDPDGKFPLFDMVRDGVRSFIKLFGPKDPPPSV